MQSLRREQISRLIRTGSAHQGKYLPLDCNSPDDFHPSGEESSITLSFTLIISPYRPEFVHVLLSNEGLAGPVLIAMAFRLAYAGVAQQTGQNREAAPLSQVLQAEQPVSHPAFAAPASPHLWKIVLMAGLLLWLYLPTLARLVGQWWHDPNFSHGFFVPLFAGFVVWQERSRLARVKAQPSWAGLFFLCFGLCTLVVGQMGAEIFLSRFSLLIVLAGMIVLFLGWSFLRALLFPLLFLSLMIPIPAIVFNQITFPLQLLASQLASTALPWLGVPVLREGNVIVLPAMALEVADACSGIRSLMSLATLAVIYGYLVERKTSLRVILALASLPIAVVANSLRVVGTGLLVQYWDPDKAEGFFHDFQGWLMFVASLGMLYLLHKFARMVWAEGGSGS